MPRKTSATNPTDWLWIAESDLEGLRLIAHHELSFHGCQGKLAEVLEKILKAELLRMGWPLEKTHDLGKLLSELMARNSLIVSAATPLVVTCLTMLISSLATPGFDLDDPDWPALRQQLEAVGRLLETVKTRVASADC